MRPSVPNMCPCYHRYVHREHRNASLSRTTLPYGPSELTALTAIRVRTRERILRLSATRWASAVIDYWDTMQPRPLGVHPICENVTQGKAGD